MMPGRAQTGLGWGAVLAVVLAASSCKEVETVRPALYAASPPTSTPPHAASESHDGAATCAIASCGADASHTEADEPPPFARPAAWPVDLPLFDAMRLTDPLTESLVGFRLDAPQQEGAAILAAWLAAATAAGYLVVLLHDDAASLRTPEGARFWVRLTSDGHGKLAGALGHARSTPARVFGACVAVPKPDQTFNVHASGISHDGEMFESSSRWHVARYTLDLDADGELDLLVPILKGKVSPCPWNLDYDVYIMRGTCGHRLGRVGPGAPALDGDAPDASGFFRLKTESNDTTHSKGPIPESYDRVIEWAFQGKSYAKRADEKSGGQCHHCAVSSCFPQH